MKIKRIIFFIVVLVFELALLLHGGKFEVLFIEMFLLFLGIMYVYSGLTKDPWLWDTITTKSMVTHFGVIGTRIFELVGGVGIIVFVVFMVIRL